MERQRLRPLRAWTCRELAHGTIQPHADTVGLRRVYGEVVRLPRREPVYPHPVRHVRQTLVPFSRRSRRLVEVAGIGTVSDDAVVFGCAARGLGGPPDNRGVVSR